MQIIKLFTIVSLLFLIFPIVTEAYNSNWSHRKVITINNTQNPNNLFDYQIFANVSYESGMNPDFSDLRFTWLNVSSNIELPVSYFIENYTNNLFAGVWINLPRVRANNYETVYMYYGKADASSESNPNTTFELYEIFEGASLDTNKWNSSGNVSVSNSEISMFDYISWILSKKEFGEQIIGEARSKWGGGIGILLSLRDDIETKYISERSNAFSVQGYHWDTSNGIRWYGDYNGPNADNYYHIWKLERNGTSSAKIYQDGKLLTALTEDLPSGNLKAGFRGGEYSGYGYYTYVDWVRIRKYADPEPSYAIGIEETLNHSFLRISFSIPETLQANHNFQAYINAKDSSDNPITNLSSSDLRTFRDNEQISFSDFRNYNNGSYSLNMSGGNVVGNISFRVETGSASAEAFSSITVGPKNKIVFIAKDWEDIFSSGLTGKPVFTGYSETEKYFLGKIKPEQVFTFSNITTDYPTFKFKNSQAFLETFYSNDTVLVVSNREQALAAAPYARLNSHPIMFDNDSEILKDFDNIVIFSAKTYDEITDIAIKEFSKAGKNINTIIITNANTETSALTGALAARHNSMIIPLNFSNISYPETVSDFYGFNNASGVLQTKEKINSTIKKLSDGFLFSNSLDYKLGRIQLNLVLLGNASEVPQPAVFDPGREMFFDSDSNYLLTDFPYADMNNDGKADIITGRIVSPYQLMELPKTNRIVTAATYRNMETVFFGNGLIESQATDTAFRMAGFETVRFVENRTNLSSYDLTFDLDSLTDFLKNLFEEQSIGESLRLLGSIYKGYDEFLEHNFYKLMTSIKIGFGGLTVKMVPDERLTRESLLGEFQNADGIFYYGKGGGNYWNLESFAESRLYFSELPPANPVIYDEHDNSARLPDSSMFDNGISAFIGSSGIVYDTYSYMPNSILVQDIAKNKSVALSLENSRHPLLPQQIKNLTASMQFNYQPERDLSLKRFIEMLCYCDPEKKIDPDAQDTGDNPTINYSATFKSMTRIPVNYYVFNNRIFFDAKQYLQEMGNFIIPLYSEETILPNGSKIVSISFNYNLSRYENISADSVPMDEHFNQNAETVHGLYPLQMFYNETFELLDGRKKVKFIAAGMQYNNDTKEAVALDNAEAVIEYSAPFEFVEFSAENISAGMNQTFKIRAVGQGLSVVIDIRSGNFSETVEKNISSGYAEISWKPPFSGNFYATAYVLMANNSAGPRYATFSAGKTGFFTLAESLGTDGYKKLMRSFTEKMQIVFNGAFAFMEYVNPLSKFFSFANSSRTEKHVSAPDYSFTVSQDSGKIIYKMKSDRGEVVLEKNAGATKEICKGDCSGLYGKMNSGSAEMREHADYVIENIAR